jgi:hypothetical protein
MTPGRPLPLAARATAASAFLAAAAVLNVVRVWAISNEAAILRAVRDGRSFSLSDAQASDDRLAALAGWYLVVLAGTGIAWCVWQHRAHANLRAFGRSGLAFTPGWAVGWWFVPVAWLWKPFQAVRELWKASDPSTESLGWRSVRTWAPIGWWWMCWIASGVISGAGTAQRGSDIDATITGDTLVMAALALQVVAAVLAIAIIRQVMARQAALAQTSAGTPALPPRVPPPPPPMPPMPAPLD